MTELTSTIQVLNKENHQKSLENIQISKSIDSLEYELKDMTEQFDGVSEQTKLLETELKRYDLVAIFSLNISRHESNE